MAEQHRKISAHSDNDVSMEEKPNYVEIKLNVLEVPGAAGRSPGGSPGRSRATSPGQGFASANSFTAPAS